MTQSVFTHCYHLETKPTVLVLCTVILCESCSPRFGHWVDEQTVWPLYCTVTHHWPQAFASIQYFPLTWDYLIPVWSCWCGPASLFTAQVICLLPWCSFANPCCYVTCISLRWFSFYFAGGLSQILLHFFPDIILAKCSYCKQSFTLVNFSSTCTLS